MNQYKAIFSVYLRKTYLINKAGPKAPGKFQLKLLRDQGRR